MVNIPDSLHQNSDLQLHRGQSAYIQGRIYWIALELKPRVGTLFCIFKQNMRQNLLYCVIHQCINSLALVHMYSIWHMPLNLS